MFIENSGPVLLSHGFSYHCCSDGTHLFDDPPGLSRNLQLKLSEALHQSINTESEQTPHLSVRTLMTDDQPSSFLSDQAASLSNIRLYLTQSDTSLCYRTPTDGPEPSGASAVPSTKQVT